jgi:hypothetical protein
MKAKADALPNAWRLVVPKTEWPIRYSFRRGLHGENVGVGMVNTDRLTGRP